MPGLSRAVFFGATVRSFNTSMGWNMGSPSQVTVQLVEDEKNNDYFLGGPADVGRPFLFQYEGFRFYGLLQRFGKSNAVDGYPTFEVTLVDPREILEGAKVIMAAYSGEVGTVPNLLNVFGWWENLVGFGQSKVNEGGMRWDKVRYAVQGMVGTPSAGPYGGPLVFRDVSYGVDLRELPAMPVHYRIGSPTMSLLELVAQVCEDGACDFFVDMDGYVIKIRTASRKKVPALGTIQRIADAGWGKTVVRSTAGVETRNELTSSFLVGGEVCTLWMNDGIKSFWGYDPFGNPVIGEPGVYDIFQNQRDVKDPPFGQLLQSVPCDFMKLTCPPDVEAILGTNQYPSSTLEMRLAKNNYDSWACFMNHCRPGWASAIGVLAPFANMGAVGQALKPNLVKDDKAAAKAWNQAAVNFDRGQASMRVYEFVKSYADAYMGKKFAVALPFLLHKQDDETLRVSTSWEVTEGGYVAEGAAPLGLSLLNEDVFKNQDGRFHAFVKYTDTDNVDTSSLTAQGLVTEVDAATGRNVLFVEAQVDPNVIYAPNPAVVVTVNNPVFERPADMFGNLGVVAAVLQMAPAKAQKMFAAAQFGNVGVKAAPAHKTPFQAAVPLKSNVLTYGPWTAVGAPGKVHYEQDASLVPWNYGGFPLMNAVGLAKVSEVLANMQFTEAGTLELAGPPRFSLGDTMQMTGPLITGMQVSVGPQGVTSSFSFQTYSHKFGGALSKQTIDRYKKLALVQGELRKNARSALRTALAKQKVFQEGVNARLFLQNAPKAIKRESPHDVFVSLVADDVDASGRAIKRTSVSTATFEEALGFCNADGAEYPYARTNVMSISGLIRPYAKAAVDGVSRYSTASGNGLTASSLDPWKAPNDIEVFSWGSEYEGLHAQRRASGVYDARPMALRGPVIMTGWGMDIEGKTVPGASYLNAWPSGYLVQPQTWVTGPTDPVWDGYRGVWTSHASLKGVVVDTLQPSGGYGTVRVDRNGTPTETVRVYNYFSSAVAAGTKVITSFIGTDNKQYVIAANC